MADDFEWDEELEREVRAGMADDDLKMRIATTPESSESLAKLEKPGTKRILYSQENQTSSNKKPFEDTHG